MSRLAVPFKQIFPQFLLDERGAISLDWVILTAGAVVLAIGAFSVFGPVGKGKIGDEHAHLSFQFLEQQKNDVAYIMYALNPNVGTDFSQMSMLETTIIRIKARMLAFRGCIGGKLNFGSTPDGTPNQVDFSYGCDYL